MLDGVHFSSAPYLSKLLFSNNGARRLLSTFMSDFCQQEVPTGNWPVGQGEKKVPLVSDGNRNGGSIGILA